MDGDPTLRTRMTGRASRLRRAGSVVSRSPALAAPALACCVASGQPVEPPPVEREDRAPAADVDNPAEPSQADSRDREQPEPGASDEETDAAERSADADTIDGPKELLDEDAVFKQVGPLPEDQDALFGAGPEGRIEEGWRALNQKLERSVGLRLGFAYTALGQWAPGSRGGTQGIGGDLDFTGAWRLVGDEEQGNAGYLGFATEWRHKLGPRPPSALGGEIGAFSRTAQSFNEQDFSLVQLWWSQELFGDTLEITAGKVSPRTFYNTNRLRNQNTSFLNQAFAGNLAVGLPGRGIGVNATFRPSDSWYLTGGIHDANGGATAGDFRTLDEGQFASIAEVGWTPRFDALGRGNYRLTVWYTDASERRGTGHGAGAAISIDQDFGEELIVFVRYAYADGDATAAEQTLSGGLGIEDVFGRERDVIGVGLGWSDPSRGAPNEELVGEVYYRVQVTDTQQLTVGWQGYLTPAFDPDDEFVSVLSVRWRVRF